MKKKYQHSPIFTRKRKHRTLRPILYYDFRYRHYIVNNKQVDRLLVSRLYRIHLAFTSVEISKIILSHPATLRYGSVSFCRSYKRYYFLPCTSVTVGDLLFCLDYLFFFFFFMCVSEHEKVLQTKLVTFRNARRFPLLLIILQRTR